MAARAEGSGSSGPLGRCRQQTRARRGPIWGAFGRRYSGCLGSDGLHLCKANLGPLAGAARARFVQQAGPVRGCREGP